MRNQLQKTKIAFVATFPPTQCGIATFTKDLITAINSSFDQTLNCVVCNITHKPKNAKEVLFVLNPKIKENYTIVANEINNDNTVKMVHIQHEFGLFGGLYGDYLLLFLDQIDIFSVL